MKKFRLVLLASALSSAFQLACAQSGPTTGYISISGGASRIDTDCSGTTSCDNSSGAAKLLAGYKIIPNLAIEASVGYLGKVTATVPNGSSSIAASIKGRSIGLGVAGLVPFGANRDWTGIARLGVASVRTTVDVSSGGMSANDGETKAAAYAGLGINYAFNPSFEFGMAYDTSRINYSGQKATAQSINLVGTFKF